MSRIGKLPIIIPSGVTLTVNGTKVDVTGPKGSLQFVMPAGVKIQTEDGKATVHTEMSNFQGLVRSMVANMVTGVTTGWSKSLELSGTGFRASTTGTELNMALGFSHPVIVKAPTGITFAVVENKITVNGSDKTMVGEIAAKIRSLRPADPYKAKGLKYEGEVIVRKAGKAAKAGATK
jgi:large subunit ribosomal protein L6